jgi:transposase
LKTISQKMHRTRAQLVKFRIAQINGLRGLLTEYGEVMPQGRAGLRRECRDKPAPACGSNTPSQSG